MKQTDLHSNSRGLGDCMGATSPSFVGTKWQNMRHYYKSQFAHLETPEFVAWFEGWYGDESTYQPEGSELLDMYWSERRFALFGWFAATLPVNVSADRMAFIRAIRGKQ